VWTQKLAGLRGLALARERHWLLAWDGDQLSLWDAAGRCLTRKQAATTLAVACSADDGQAYAASGAEGQLWYLSDELRTRWETRLPARPLAVALSPLGEHLAAADAAGGLQLCDATGRRLWRTTVPRPLDRLAFIPEHPLLVGCAAAALVVCYDLTGRQAWRDSHVANFGSLSVTGNGDRIALACWSEGVCCWDRAGRKLPPLSGLGAVARVKQSYDGSRLLVEDPNHRVSLRKPSGELISECPLEARPVALALDALGRSVAAALADGTLLLLASQS
jgi:hypothetical protein